MSVLLSTAGVAESQRIRATAPVTFYAAPDGKDQDNNCLSKANPCTPGWAHSVARRDWDFSLNGCTIRLADGVYTDTVAIAGQYVGTHLCQVYGHVDQNDICLDAVAVVFDVPNGRAAFDVQDGMMTSVACVTVRGHGAIGFFGRQFVIIDLAYINCAEITKCITLTANAGVNVALDNWSPGNSECFVCADRQSRVTFAGTARLIAVEPVKVDYFSSATTTV